jgi:YHS domain-containing protein
LITLLKFAAILFLAWMLYKGVRSLLAGGTQKERMGGRRDGEGEVLDIMVQDPQCGTYVPQGQAVRAKLNGQELFFCSRECRDKFLAENKQ